MHFRQCHPSWGDLPPGNVDLLSSGLRRHNFNFQSHPSRTATTKGTCFGNYGISAPGPRSRGRQKLRPAEQRSAYHRSPRQRSRIARRTHGSRTPRTGKFPVLRPPRSRKLRLSETQPKQSTALRCDAGTFCKNRCADLRPAEWPRNGCDHKGTRH